MKKPIRILLIILVVTGVAFFIWQKKNHQNSGELTLFGNVDIREVNLGFRVNGRIQEILKDEGDAVGKDEIIARLDAEPYQRELEQSEAQVASLQARLDTLLNGNRREDIEQARATLNEREASLGNAQRLFNRQKDLLKTKVASQQEYDDASAALKQIQAQTNSAQAALKLQEAGARVEDIAQARANLAQAKSAVETAWIHLSDTVLKSPSKGVVITRALEPGAIVSSGATALTVSLEDPVWARAYIDEPHLGAIHPGAEVRVFTDSRPDQPYHGKVGYISPRAEFTPKSVETAELRTSLVYRLRIVVSDADSALRQGMPVTVKLAVP